MAPGVRVYRLGSQVVLDDLTKQGYFRVQKHDETTPLRILEGEIDCDGVRLWVEVIVHESKIQDVRLVEMTLEVLARLHYLPPDDYAFWGWAATLPDPTRWVDELATRDRVEVLRLQLTLHEPIPARAPREARILIEDVLRCAQVTPLTLSVHGERRLWRTSCRSSEQSIPEFTLTFLLDSESDDPDPFAPPHLPGASRILPANAFWALFLSLSRSVEFELEDIDEDDRSMPRARLQDARAYVQQMVALIPPGESLIPLAAFWGDMARHDRAEHPGRYSRLRLTTMSETWAFELSRSENSGRRGSRGLFEERAFLLLHPCSRCNTSSADLDMVVSDALVDYRGSCPSCGQPRHVRFNRSLEPIMNSRLFLDTVQLVLASQVAASVGDLALARWSLETAAASISASRDATPEVLIWSRQGWLAYDADEWLLATSHLTSMLRDLTE